MTRGCKKPGLMVRLKNAISTSASSVNRTAAFGSDDIFPITSLTISTSADKHESDQCSFTNRVYLPFSDWSAQLSQIMPFVLSARNWQWLWGNKPSWFGYVLRFRESLRQRKSSSARNGRNEEIVARHGQQPSR